MTEDEAKMIGRAIVDAFIERMGVAAPAPCTPPSPSEPRYMKVCDFAKSSGFSRATIQDYVKRGMPAIKLGKRGHRIDVKAAREWLAIGGASTQGELHS